MSEKVIIIGATSGIGKALTEEFVARGSEVGITGRREHYLEELRNTAPNQIHTQVMDVTKFEDARNALKELIGRMGGVDILVVNAGMGDSIPTVEKEIQIINTNTTGFVNIMRTGLDYMKSTSGGKLVGITSVAGARGFKMMTVYGATKRFASHYMEGLRHFISKKRLPIKVIDIRPGFIETAMTEGNNLVFWQIPVDKAARRMMKIIDSGKKVAYVPRRWSLIYNTWRILPRWISYKI